MPLTASLLSATDLNPARRASMYALMTEHYHHVRRADFDRDLAGKDWVILLHDDRARLRGFSTQVTFEHRYRDETLRVLFSGDTIVAPDAWGGLQLPLMFGRMVSAVKQAHPHQRLFWMLITKGFRTYRFLPTFFRTFYPHHAHSTPDWEQGLIHALAERRFPGAYDRTRGLIRGGQDAQALHADLATDRCRRTRSNPHIDFFFRANPDHTRGDELVCLAEFSPSNLKPFILREMSRTRVALPPRRPAEAVRP